MSGIFYYYLYNECLQVCPKGYYGDKQLNLCKFCDSRCASCFDAGNGSCLTCKVNNNSVTHYLIYNTVICSDGCPDGQYANATSFRC